VTDSTGALTAAEHRALAENDMRQMRGISAGSAAYSNLALSAIAHTLAAVAHYLDPDMVTEPEVRLPGGQVVRTRQNNSGHFWGYIISSPGGEPDQVSRCHWGTPETALAAGAAAAAMGPAMAGSMDSSGDSDGDGCDEYQPSPAGQDGQVA
jgi:hypothetical protein